MATTKRIVKKETFLPATGNPVFQVVEEWTIDGQVFKQPPRNPTAAELEDANEQIVATFQDRIAELESAAETLTAERDAMTAARDEAIAANAPLLEQVESLESRIEELTAVPDVPVITPRQAKLALYGAGMLDDVETAIAAADKVIQIAYESATEWRRDDPVLSGLAGAIGLTDEQLDELFATAATL